MSLRKTILLASGLALLHAVLFGSVFAADDLNVAANAVNALGIDLLAQVGKPNANALISPYSIQSALAMTYAGAAGDTKAEMARVLHYPTDEAELHRSFAAFRRELDEIHESTAIAAKDPTEHEGPSDPVTLAIANRLYGQSGYAFRPEFLSLVKDNYSAPLAEVDFAHAFESVGSEINRWVAEVTQDRICNLIPPGILDKDTKLVLVNAIYLKAPWTHCFAQSDTKEELFFVRGTERTQVQTMQNKAHYGYKRGNGFSAITLHYFGDELQLLVLLPDRKNGLEALEKKLTPQLLAKYADPDPTELILHLPKFKLEPPMLPLGLLLQSLGMKRAFDQPRFSADFGRMALPDPKGYLKLSEVFHKTFFALDEKGTEAAAATGGVIELAPFSVGENPPKPIEIKVDHPFLFAIQHRASGACLFLGRVVDPR
jgi:serpin B